MRGNIRSRGGFTVIELLAVVTIIAILLAMTAAAVFRLSGSQQQKRTETDIVKIHSLFDQHWKVVADKSMRESIPTAGANSAFVLAEQEPRRARAIWVMLNLKREFPMTPQEVNTNLSSTGLASAYHPTYIREFSPNPAANPPQVYQSTKAGTLKTAEESSALLYQALSQGRGGVTGSVDEIGSTALGSAEFVEGANRKTFKFFVDAWGRPITFVRWATDTGLYAELNAPPYTVGRPNRYDPDGTFIPPVPWTNAVKTNARNVLNAGGTPPAGDPLYPVGNNNYAPYLRSMGKDAVSVNDDILSYRLRQSGAKGN